MHGFTCQQLSSAEAGLYLCAAVQISIVRKQAWWTKFLVGRVVLM